MDTRYLDIIDASGKIERSVPVEIAHKELLLHRSIHILVVNDGAEIYVRLRPQTKAIYPNLWTSSVGAHVLSGSSPDETAKKELKNFLGLEVPLQKIGEQKVADTFENELITIYTCRSNSVALNKLEGDAGEFMNTEKINQLANEGKTTPHLLTSLKVFNS